MYGLVKFENWEIRKETKYSKLNYYYKDQKTNEDELKAIVSNELVENAKKMFKSNIIEKEQFKNSSVLEIVMPENIIAIEDDGFANCRKLKSIELSNNIETINEYAFYNCESLESVIIPENVKYIDNHVFDGCINLVNIIFPENITNIGYGAFSRCENLKDIIIPKNVESIEDYAFFRCKTLKNIIVPKNVNSIGFCAFYYCERLENVTILNSNIEYDQYTFDEGVEIKIKGNLNKSLDTIIKDYTVDQDKKNIEEEIEKEL